MTPLAGEGSAISATATIAGRPRQTRRPRLRIFVIGYLLWVASVLVAFTASKSAAFPPSSCLAASWSRSPSWSTPLGAPTWSSRPNTYPPISSIVGEDCGVVEGAIGRHLPVALAAQRARFPGRVSADPGVLPLMIAFVALAHRNGRP
jgi:hypothetical protein